MAVRSIVNNNRRVILLHYHSSHPVRLRPNATGQCDLENTKTPKHQPPMWVDVLFLARREIAGPSPGTRPSPRNLGIFLSLFCILHYSQSIYHRIVVYSIALPFRLQGQASVANTKTWRDLSSHKAWKRR